MANISIFGKGSMGKAIGDNFTKAGNTVHYLDSKTPRTSLGDIVVLAVPYPAVSDIIEQYKDELKEKKLLWILQIRLILQLLMI